MSLINDALKRAKEAQKENPPPPSSLQFRPADPSQRASAGSPVLLVVAAIIVLGVVGLLAALMLQKRTAARSVADAKQSAVAVPQPASSVALASTPNSVPMLEPALESAAGVSQEPSVATATPAADAGTNAALASVAPEPPPLPKLQGIFYRPGRPSAVVNGKNVYIGTRFGEFQVLAISHESVTIGSATQTNVLVLE